MAELQAILSELANPGHPNDVHRRVELCRQALALLGRDQNPPLWAALNEQLAIGLAGDQQGERADNLERAIEHYGAALTVYTLGTFPADWARTRNNLGLTYRRRIRGERVKNIECAIRHYEEALKVRTREAFPQDWADTQNNLANAYGDRIRGERVKNICIGFDMIGQPSDLGVRLRASDRLAQPVAVTGSRC